MTGFSLTPPAKTPEELEEEAAIEAARINAENAGEEGGAPPPIMESKVDEDGNPLDSSQVGGMGASFVPREQRQYDQAEDAAMTGQVQRTEILDLPATWPFRDTRYGNTEELELQVHVYAMGEAVALQSVIKETGEPFARYTLNVGGGLPGGTIAIKNYSEGEGAVEVLQGNGVIQGEPVSFVMSGFVTVPVYEMTEKFRAWLDKYGTRL